MDNKVSRRIKLLIAAVLVLFLAVSALDVVSDGGRAFEMGYRTGRADSQGMILKGERHMLASVELLDPDADTRALADGVKLIPWEIAGELVVPEGAGRGSGWALAATILLSLAMLGATIAFVVSLVLFCCGFPRRPILSDGNITQMRWMAWSLGGLGLAAWGMMMQEYLWLRANVVLDGFRMSIPSPPSALIVALILVAMTEIMNLADRLQHEQELTI